MERVIIGISVAVLITSIIIGWTAINTSNQTNELLEKMNEILNKQLEIERYSPIFETDGNSIQIKPSHAQSSLFSYQDEITITYESGHIITFSIPNATLEIPEKRGKCIFEKEPKLSAFWYGPYPKLEDQKPNEEKFIVVFELEDFEFKISVAFEVNIGENTRGIAFGEVVYQIEAFDIQTKEIYPLNATTMLFVYTDDNMYDLATFYC